MLRILCRRLFLAVLVIFGVIVVTFVISRLIPGDPARLMSGEHASRETVEHMRHVLGLDRPLPEQFAVYLVKLSHGDLGVSIRTERPVSDDIRHSISRSLDLQEPRPFPYPVVDAVRPAGGQLRGDQRYGRQEHDRR